MPPLDVARRNHIRAIILEEPFLIVFPTLIAKRYEARTGEPIHRSTVYIAIKQHGLKWARRSLVHDECMEALLELYKEHAADAGRKRRSK